MGITEVDKIFSIDEQKFSKLCLEVFHYQAKRIPVYREYLSRLDIQPESIRNIQEIPFMSVEMFRNRKIMPAGKEADLVFESSGTTGQVRSKHHVADGRMYIKSLHQSFQLFFGDIRNYCILALLPSYLERKSSSLVYMCDQLIKGSGHRNSGFYLNEFRRLYDVLTKLEAKEQNTILIGASFALLDFAEQYPIRLNKVRIMETGGMKGRRREITRAELHQRLKDGFGIQTVSSEYGMTEMLSQAYAARDGIFHAPPWLKILIRDPYDPFSYLEHGKSGGINVIDLANIYSCSFLMTGDLGRLTGDGAFTVEGRFDQSEIRGCNLLV